MDTTVKTTITNINDKSKKNSEHTFEKMFTQSLSTNKNTVKNVSSLKTTKMEPKIDVKRSDSFYTDKFDGKFKRKTSFSNGLTYITEISDNDVYELVKNADKDIIRKQQIFDNFCKNKTKYSYDKLEVTEKTGFYGDQRQLFAPQKTHEMKFDDTVYDYGYKMADENETRYSKAEIIHEYRKSMFSSILEAITFAMFTFNMLKPVTTNHNIFVKTFFVLPFTAAHNAIHLVISLLIWPFIWWTTLPFRIFRHLMYPFRHGYHSPVKMHTEFESTAGPAYLLVNLTIFILSFFTNIVPLLQSLDPWHGETVLGTLVDTTIKNININVFHAKDAGTLFAGILCLGLMVSFVEIFYMLKVNTLIFIGFLCWFVVEVGKVLFNAYYNPKTLPDYMRRCAEHMESTKNPNMTIGPELFALDKIDSLFVEQCIIKGFLCIIGTIPILNMIVFTWLENKTAKLS